MIQKNREIARRFWDIYKKFVSLVYRGSFYENKNG